MDTKGQKEASGGFKAKYGKMSAARIQALFSKSAVFSLRYVLGSGCNSHGLVGGVLRTKRSPKRSDGSIEGIRD